MSIRKNAPTVKDKVIHRGPTWYYPQKALLTVIHKEPYISLMSSSYPNRDLKQIWQSVLGQIELKFSSSIVNTWFNNTKLEELRGKKATISCKTPYAKDVLSKRYQKAIRNFLKQATEKEFNVQFVVQKEKASDAKGPLFDQPPEEMEKGPQKAPSVTEPNLNPRFTFENFVVGNCNRVAYAAALAVVDQPGTAYNPLFIYGKSGLGKTHLLNAIGNKLLKTGKAKQIRYFPVETFIKDFIESIRYKRTPQFKKAYRNNDCILVDDIQFIGSKMGTQEEFFHTFNELHNHSKQIVICSDRHPSEIKKLTERLFTRFAGGLMAELGTPDYETRLAIIQTKAANLGLELNTEACDLVAQCAGESVREIEGLVLKIRSESLAQDIAPTPGVVKSILNSNNGRPKKRRRLTPELIFELINEYFNTSMSQICGRKRKKEIVIPRQIAMYLLRNDLGLNLEHIGELLGGRDHTTVLHGTEKISQMMLKKAPIVTSAVRDIRRKLY